MLIDYGNSHILFEIDFLLFMLNFITVFIASQQISTIIKAEFHFDFQRKNYPRILKMKWNKAWGNFFEIKYQNPTCSYIDIRKTMEEKKKKEKTSVFSIRLFKDHWNYNR